MLRAITLISARSFVSVAHAQRRRVISVTLMATPQYSFAAPASPYPHRPFGTTPPADKEDYQKFIESLSPARKKFLDALYEYHASNFEHTTPNRFFKMIVKAVDKNHDGVITMEEFKTLLKNIGAYDKLSEEDILEIFEEVGDEVLDEEKVITVESIEKRWSPFLHVLWKK